MSDSVNTLPTSKNRINETGASYRTLSEVSTSLGPLPIVLLHVFLTLVMIGLLLSIMM
ncbi:MAG: hypothetical protein AAGF95_33350 [Chloroflexota bacterium]